MSKRVLVLFSGGLDSTYLIWKNLKDGNIVTPVYIEIKNNETKSILEKNRIELLYKEFKKEFKESILRDIIYAVNVSVSAYEDSLYFKQVPIWLFGMMFLQSTNVDEIQIGYVSNDDAISYLSDIQKIYKSYQVICEPMKPLKFPLTKMKKYQMAKELPEQYLKLIISCENAKIIGSKDAEFIEYEPCCECVPCKGIIASDYYMTYKFPKNYERNLLIRHAREIYQKKYKVVDENNKEFDYWGDELPTQKNVLPYQLEFNFNCVDMKLLDNNCVEISKSNING